MKTTLLLILIFGMFNVGCEDLLGVTYRFRVQNNSADTIQYYASYSFPDTSILNSKPRLRFAAPFDFGFWDSKDDFKDLTPSGVISIYILSKDTVDAHSWEEISQQYKILKRYEISISEMENNGWEITYP